ncbi:MAG: YbjN domain-containing protein [Chloroflexota bacterium]
MSAVDPPFTDPPHAVASAVDVERWLAELGVGPERRVERDAVVSWDLELDGRRRFGIPVTLILDPSLALIIWVHFAPPIGDSFRVSYRKLLRWNDEFPFVKFAIAPDERPILTAEIPIARLDRDELGLALARVLATCDRLLEASAAWLWYDGRIPPQDGRTSRQAALLDRYADRLAELIEP